MHRKHAILVPQSLALLLGAAPAWSQDSDREALDEIVVSATRTETSVRDVARSISIVDAERIQGATQQLALDEALAGVPGLFMLNRYNFAQDLRVSLRGFGARSAFGIRGIKIIVDGIPETLPDGQAGVDSIDLGSAGRIEVLRGPSSTLYGNASGGVISIQTESVRDFPFVEANLAAGELGYQKYQLKTGGTAGKLDYLVNVAAQEIDGYRDHSRAEGTVLNSRLAYRFTDDDVLTVALNHTDQPVSKDAGGLNAAEVAANRRAARSTNVLFDADEALDQQRIGFVYQRKRDAGDLTLRNYYVWRDFENSLPFEAGGAVDLDRFFYGFGGQYTFGDMFPEALDLTTGIDVDRQDDERRRFDNLQGSQGPLVFDQQERVDAAGVFANFQYRFADRWTLSGGLRYDEISFDISDRYLADGDDSGSIDFDRVSPSLGVSLDLGSGMLFGSYSSSFETPTTTELANPDGSGGFNASLEPQTADNFELGYKGGDRQLYYELAVFDISLEGELVPFELEQFPGRTFYSNAGKSSRTGMEAAVSWTGDSGFGVDASYTWSDFAFDEFVDENGTDFSGRRLPGLPRRFGYLGLRYQDERGLNAVLETSYAGDMYANNANSAVVPSYTVAGVRVSYDFIRGPWKFRPYVGVNNLFDEKYNSNIRINAFGGRYYEPAPERNAYAGIVVTWQGGAG
ncbi:MAG: TonB-dependent receptor [Gammaproteobacteria bacterium]|nr:TonB-dependent receptor [Gammaproteobacteria bacterium]MDH4255019.1 TonB-dependent receptor [Gammaproteobacteria bacterium]MDH5310782.1 TonB-dependent receptor [Gammaproteobacteria bacterium]